MFWGFALELGQTSESRNCWIWHEHFASPLSLVSERFSEGLWSKGLHRRVKPSRFEWCRSQPGSSSVFKSWMNSGFEPAICSSGKMWHVASESMQVNHNSSKFNILLEQLAVNLNRSASFQGVQAQPWFCLDSDLDFLCTSLHSWTLTSLSIFVRSWRMICLMSLWPSWPVAPPKSYIEWQWLSVQQHSSAESAFLKRWSSRASLDFFEKWALISFQLAPSRDGPTDADFPSIATFEIQLHQLRSLVGRPGSQMCKPFWSFDQLLRHYFATSSAILWCFGFQRLYISTASLGILTELWLCSNSVCQQGGVRLTVVDWLAMTCFGSTRFNRSTLTIQQVTLVAGKLRPRQQFPRRAKDTTRA